MILSVYIAKYQCMYVSICCCMIFCLQIQIKIIQSRKVIANIFSKKRQTILAIKLEIKAVYSKPDIQKIILVLSDMNYKQKDKKNN